MSRLVVSVGILAITLGACGRGSDRSASKLADGEVKSVAFNITLKDSKELYIHRIESYSIDLTTAAGVENLPCRNFGFNLDGSKSLFDGDGWSDSKFDVYGDDTKDGSAYRPYMLASCRTANTEVLAWFGQKRKYESSLDEEFISDKYSPEQMPVLVRVRDLLSGEKVFQKCDQKFTKEKVSGGETDRFIIYKLGIACSATKEPNPTQRSVIDFVDSPGRMAHVAAYRAWLLPAVSANADELNKASTKALSVVPAGKYSGIMTTEAKTCNVSVSATESALTIVHEITAGGSSRPRTVEITPSTLRGFTAGDTYKDPIRATGDVIGKFAAVQGENLKKQGAWPYVFKFENNPARVDGKKTDGLVVRINGSEAYCRRLKKVD